MKKLMVLKIQKNIIVKMIQNAEKFLQKDKLKHINMENN